MGLTRPQRLQQARTASHNKAANASVLRAASYIILELAFASLFAVSQRRDPTLRLKWKSLLEPGRRSQFYAVDAGKNSTFSCGITQRQKCSPPSRKQRRN